MADTVMSSNNNDDSNNNNSDNSNNNSENTNPNPNRVPVSNVERLRIFRSSFCPISMVNNDGSVHQPYFDAKPMARQWTDVEKMVLLKGISEFGIFGTGAWNKIVKKWLPQRTFIEIRIQLARMLGRQDLTIYKDVKFTSELEIQREFKKNRAQAKKEGKWECGMFMNGVTDEMLVKIAGKRKKQAKLRILRDKEQAATLAKLKKRTNTFGLSRARRKPKPKFKVQKNKINFKKEDEKEADNNNNNNNNNNSKRKSVKKNENSKKKTTTKSGKKSKKSKSDEDENQQKIDMLMKKQSTNLKKNDSPKDKSKKMDMDLNKNHDSSNDEEQDDDVIDVD